MRTYSTEGTIATKVPPELLRLIDRKCAVEDRTRSQVVRQALREFFYGADLEPSQARKAERVG